MTSQIFVVARESVRIIDRYVRAVSQKIERQSARRTMFRITNWPFTKIDLADLDWSKQESDLIPTRNLRGYARCGMILLMEFCIRPIFSEGLSVDDAAHFSLLLN